jgi:hypothetical protein
VRRKWKLLPLLAVGTMIFVVLAGAITGNWTWLIDENPYLKFESQGKFNPGHGNFFFYANNYQHITGLAISILLILALMLLAAHVVYLLRRRTPEEKSRYAFWLLAPLFLSFFLAHSYIWWNGSMGSHGLLRVFVVVAPCAALLASYAMDKLLAFDIRILNKSLPIILVFLCIHLCYQGSWYPYPWVAERSIPGYPAERNIEQAFDYIQKNGLEKHTVVHQIPFINAQKGWDPFGDPLTAKSLYIWCLNSDPKKDWLPDSSVVIWDGWHAVRDAPMPLDSMRALPHYKEIAYFPDKDSIYDVRLFIKAPNK